MFVYSNRIVKFINEIKDSIKDILSREIRVKVSGERFYDLRQDCSYPIAVVIYNNRRMLGYFDSDFYELGFHECLMHSSREQLHNIIRHELAHYFIFNTYGHYADPHGSEFRAFCQRLGWGEEVYRAAIYLEGDFSKQEEENGVLRKVQKLMALTTSSNHNEAEQAVIKSRQLLLKHNIDSQYISKEDEDKIIVKRIMRQKKETAKMRSIAKILETFFVNIVYHRAGEFTYLEILGNAVNIEIAEYVAAILHDEMERLWEQAKQQRAGLKGMVAKNSFFQGIAKGYCNKISALKSGYGSDIVKALIVLENKLIDAKAMVYPRLSACRSQAKYCAESSRVGEQMGRNLTINPAIKQSSNNSGAFIAYADK